MTNSFFLSFSNLINSELIDIDNKIFDFCSYQNSFLSPDLLSLIFSNSKKIRSALTILTLKALNLSISIEDISICALSEIIHNASLIHDDIIDNAISRRFAPSINKKLGNKNAVIIGDFLISIASNNLFSLENSEVTKLYTNSLFNLCQGELFELHNKNKIISLSDYILKNKLKTADLFKTTLYSTFLMKGLYEYLDFAKNFATYFGIAFQIKDDISDFISAKNDKPIFNDFKNGICTAPMIFAATDETSLNQLTIDKILNSDALQKSKQLCEKYSHLALDLLNNFADNQYNEILKSMCMDLTRNF
jgi:geranylgeranyl pyrophosphate synthase